MASHTTSFAERNGATFLESASGLNGVVGLFLLLVFSLRNVQAVVLKGQMPLPLVVQYEPLNGR